MLRANKHDRQFWETSWMNYIDKNKFKRGIYKELGDMYMKFVSLGENGQFFTPPHIADMVAQIVDTKSLREGETVYDCACGSGTLLLGALKNNPQCRLYGVDLDRRCVMMALLNCFWYGGCGEFIVGNTLTNEYSEGRRCSYGMIYELDLNLNNNKEDDNIIKNTDNKSFKEAKLF